MTSKYSKERKAIQENRKFSSDIGMFKILQLINDPDISDEDLDKLNAKASDNMDNFLGTLR